MASTNSKLFDDSSIVDLIVDPNDARVKEKIDLDQCLDLLEELLEKLPDRERRAMELRYGLNGSMPRTYQQIGDLLNVSRERVRQIEANCLKRMRKKLAFIKSKSGL